MLAGATVAVSNTRSDSRRAYYFIIKHPECGTREFSAKSKTRRKQWLDKINYVINNLSQVSTYGILQKQGGSGMSGKPWQERWCVTLGPSLYYFEKASDTVPKGSLDLMNASIKPIKEKSRPFCIEVTAFEKKKGKKYVFCVDSEFKLDKWLKAIKVCSKLERHGRSSVSSESVPDAENVGEIVSENPLVSQTVSRKGSNTRKPQLRKGALLKKSHGFGAMQLRFFVLNEDGRMFYYVSPDDADRGVGEKGVWDLKDVPLDGGIELSGKKDIRIMVGSKEYILQGQDTEEAISWIDTISSWLVYLHK